MYLQNSSHVNNVRKWVPKDGSGDQAKLQVERMTNMTKQFQIIVVTNFHGESYFEILQDGGSINSDRYLKFCTNAFDHLHFDNLTKHNVLWMHDNAPPHRSLQTQAFFEQSGIRLLKQPAYSPDYNLHDRFTFRNFEVFRRDKEFQGVEDIRQYV